MSSNRQKSRRRKEGSNLVTTNDKSNKNQSAYFVPKSKEKLLITNINFDNIIKNKNLNLFSCSRDEDVNRITIIDKDFEDSEKKLISLNNFGTENSISMMEASEKIKNLSKDSCIENKKKSPNSINSDGFKRTKKLLCK